MSINIIGISAFYHDSACCLLQDGILKAAAQEERFSRKKNDPDLPRESFLFCLEQAGLNINDIDCIAYYEDPAKKLARQLWSRTDKISINNIFDMNPNNVENNLREQLGFDGLIKFYDHHLSHAASAFYYSGFEKSAILTVDGVGEWATTTYGLGNGKEIKLFEEVHFPDSLGLLYSTMTSYLGFHVNSGEYKVMGLAPYGKAKYTDKIRSLIEIRPAGQYNLVMKYFDFVKGDRMYSDALIDLFGYAQRKPESEMQQFYIDVAKSLQVVLEEILLAKAIYLYEKTDTDNLCMAGGVALNCVANGHILKNSPFKRLFVQPAANDSGCALGAAALANAELAVNFSNTTLKHVYLGPEYKADEIEKLLNSTSLKYGNYRDNLSGLLDETAKRLSEGKVIGWFQGRMEFGPRSLGTRSILADPRDLNMRERINAMVKKREGFRPFAPAILHDRVSEHFDIDHPSPFMLETCQVISKLQLPAVTHVDGSARVQTVTKDTNPRFAALLESFEKLTGCPILLNTSFNVRGEPIVCAPEEAIICFATTDIDCLIIEDFIIDISDNDRSLLAMIHENFVEKNEEAINHDVYTFI